MRAQSLKKWWVLAGLLAASVSAQAQTPLTYPNTAQMLQSIMTATAHSAYLDHPQDLTNTPTAFACFSQVMFAPEVLNAAMAEAPKADIQALEQQLSEKPEVMRAFQTSMQNVVAAKKADKADELGSKAFDQLGEAIGQAAFITLVGTVAQIPAVMDRPEIEPLFEKASHTPECERFAQQEEGAK